MSGNFGYATGGYQQNPYDAGAGGFVNSPFNASQPGAGDTSPTSKKSVTIQTLRPVTVHQILNAFQPHADADFKIDNVEVMQVKIVGVIRNMMKQSTNISYTVEDGTGSIDVRKWIDNEETEEVDTELRTGVYVRVIGNLNRFGNKQHLGVYHMEPIRDFNEVTFHMLECIATHLYFTKGTPNTTSALNNSIYNPQSAFISGNAAGDMGGMSGYTPVQSRIMQIVREEPDTNEGTNVNVIKQKLQGQFSREEVQNAIDWLINEGHLYSTVDDDHVKSTDN
ncbi:uncharacterized protein VTP21DRAFT_3593 [Calcarisporiella thermophila]|uniref:uncharacterized protein n=1 Tax=Calcarisporiella thermophila TaxID=911321 RepID=UPI0037445A88